MSETPVDTARPCASDLMRRDVLTLAPETPVLEVVGIMRQHGIHRVLVGLDGRLGIITSFDLIALLGGEA